MNQIKSLVIIFFFLCFMSACDKETRKDVEQKIDTIKDKVTKEVDTVTKKITQSSNDSIFKDVKVNMADTAGMAPEDFRELLTDVFKDYIDIKNALADNDSTDAGNQANQLKKSLSKIKDDSLRGKLKSAWKNNSAKIEKLVSDIAAAENIEKQRMLFAQLTEIILNNIKMYGLEGKTVYQMYCKDAMKNKGASWLADGKDVDNPYLGKLTEADKEKICAEVKNAWKFD